MRRTLFLRPYRDAQRDHFLLAAVAAGATQHGNLVVVGPRKGYAWVNAVIQSAQAKAMIVGDRIEYVESQDDSWKRIVHEQIALADCILVHFAPKGRRFPPLRAKKIPAHQFILSPVAEKSSGEGLLQEMQYIERLRQLTRTSLLCSSDHKSYLKRLLDSAELQDQGGGLIGSGCTLDSHVKLTALDQELVSINSTRSVQVLEREQLRTPLVSEIPARVSSIVRERTGGLLLVARKGRGESIP